MDAVVVPLARMVTCSSIFIWKLGADPLLITSVVNGRVCTIPTGLPVKWLLDSSPVLSLDQFALRKAI